MKREEAVSGVRERHMGAQLVGARSGSLFGPWRVVPHPVGLARWVGLDAACTNTSNSEGWRQSWWAFEQGVSYRLDLDHGLNALGSARGAPMRPILLLGLGRVGQRGVHAAMSK